MKNRFVTILVVLSMLFVFVGSAAAAPGVRYLGGIWAGGHVIFTFQVDEDLGDKWIHANVSWDGGSAQVTCNQDGEIVRCVAPADAADKKVHVTFQGAGYVDFVKSQEESSKNCYSVWDWGEGESWQDFGPYCQDTPANFGDTVVLEVNPYYPGTWTYTFLPNGNPCSGLIGDAYYFCNSNEGE